MSISSWKQQYFFISASAAAKNGAVAALGHSYLKYTGLLTRNLRRHKLKYDTTDILLRDPKTKDVLPILGIDNCALCQFYLVDRESCAGCPIFKNSGSMCSDPDSTYGKLVGTRGDRQTLIKKLLSHMCPSVGI